MRHAPEQLFLRTNKRFVGIHLAADFTAEHEWGIRELKSKFGIPERELTDGPFGVEREKAQAVPETLVYQEEKKGITGLAVITYHFQLEDVKLSEYSELNYTMHPPREDPRRDTSSFKTYDFEATGAWDGNSFGIRAKGDKARECLSELHEAIKQTDVCLFLGGAGPFQNAGLTIAIASRIPQDLQKLMRDTHRDTANLHKKAKATGIYDVVPRDKYYALSPRWKDSKKRSVVFWLNPTDQKNNNYGSFTVTELKQWMKGKGPIPKTDEDK